MRSGPTLLAVALSAHAATASAQGTAVPAGAEASGRSQASESFAEAKAAFARGDFAAAAAAFEQAARLAPHPATWLNAAEAWERRGEWVRAAEDCDHALDAAGDRAEFRREAEGRLTRALARVGTLEAAGPRTASVRVDGSDARQLPVRLRLSPGAHRVVFTELATGREQVKPVTLRAGAVTSLEAEPFEHAASSSSSSSPPLGSWICFGLAGVFAVPTTIFGVSTLNAKSDYDAAPTRDKLDRFNLDRTLTDVSLAAAVVSLGVGVGIWIVTARGRSDTRRGALTVPFTPGVEF